MTNVPEVSGSIGTAALSLRGISKSYGATNALQSVDLTLAQGEIHALLGENGAGKSTLMKIVRGLTRPDAGQIFVNGQPTVLRSPQDAARAGIGMVHQHFLLVSAFTVAENLLLSYTRSAALSPNPTAFLDRAKLRAEQLGWGLPMGKRVSDLAVGAQQRLEILKALLAEAKILLFDEPTAVLAPGEISELLDVMRALRGEGRSIVFVSHKLREVMAVCDRVTVLRRGRNAGTVAVTETSEEDLARRMVGEGSALPVIQSALRLGEVASRKSHKPLAVIEKISTRAGDGVALRDISFTLAEGEVLGFAGVDGNGQAELAEVLTGLRPLQSGRMSLDGASLSRLKPWDLERLKMATVPPDRHREGLALDLSVSDNLSMEAAHLREFNAGPFLKSKALRAFAERIARDFDVRTESLAIPVSSLSGGNQQKVVIARALWRQPRFLVAVSPTRGLDVAATAYVHQKIRERQADGGAVVLISTELDEVIALSTRIAVLYEGRIVGIVAANTPRETLGLMMGGAAA